MTLQPIAIKVVNNAFQCYFLLFMLQTIFMFLGLDKYWETLNGILWPRLTQVLTHDLVMSYYKTGFKSDAVKNITHSCPHIY